MFMTFLFFFITLKERGVGESKEERLYTRSGIYNGISKNNDING